MIHVVSLHKGVGTPANPLVVVDYGISGDGIMLYVIGWLPPLPPSHPTHTHRSVVVRTVMWVSDTQMGSHKWGRATMSLRYGTSLAALNEYRTSACGFASAWDLPLLEKDLALVIGFPHCGEASVVCELYLIDGGGIKDIGQVWAQLPFLSNTCPSLGRRARWKRFFLMLTFVEGTFLWVVTLGGNLWGNLKSILVDVEIVRCMPKRQWLLYIWFMIMFHISMLERVWLLNVRLRGILTRMSSKMNN